MQRDGAPSAKKSAKILLADDSPNIHKAVALGLRKEDYEILYCDNGQDALRILRDNKPELALLDLDMPGPNGAELVQIIRKDPQMASAKVVLLCSSFDQIDEAHLDTLPADGRIWKPFEAHVLLSLIKKVLSSPPVHSNVRVSQEQTSALGNPPPPPKKNQQKTQDLSDDLMKSMTAETFKKVEAATSALEDEITAIRDIPSLEDDAPLYKEEATLPLNSPLQSDDILDRLNQSPDPRETQESTWAIPNVELDRDSAVHQKIGIEDYPIPPGPTATHHEDADALWGESSAEDSGTATLSIPVAAPKVSEEATVAIADTPSVQASFNSSVLSHLTPTVSGLSEAEVRKIIREEMENAFSSWFRSNLEERLSQILNQIERES